LKIDPIIIIGVKSLKAQSLTACGGMNIAKIVLVRRAGKDWFNGVFAIAAQGVEKNY
jgi:hypothetical protein